MSRDSESDVRSRRLILGVAALVTVAALLANLFWLAGLESGIHWPDERWYLGYARALVQDVPFPDAMRRAPGAAHFYAMALGIEDSWVSLRAANLVVGILTSTAVYWGTRRLFRSQLVGVLAGLACLAYPFFVYLRGFALSETLTIFLLALFAAALLRADEAESPVVWITAGGLAGLANFVRPVLLLVPVVVAGVLWLRSEYGRGEAARIGVLLAVGWALVVGPWLTHNKISTGEWQFSSHGACEVYKGVVTGPDANPSTVEVPTDPDLCGSATAEYLTRRPERVIANKAYSAYRFWSPELDFVTSQDASRGWMQTASYAVLLPLYVLAFLGWRETDERKRWLLLAVVLSYWLLHVLAVVKFRYRIPLDVVLLMFAAGGTARLAKGAWSVTVQIIRR